MVDDTYDDRSRPNPAANPPEPVATGDGRRGRAGSGGGSSPLLYFSAVAVLLVVFLAVIVLVR